MTDYAVAHVDDIPELADGGCPIRPVRHHFGITGVGINAFTARAAILRAEPRYGLVFYNVACCESLTGRTAEALDHLRQAIELSDRYRDCAKNDSGLDAIRDEPGFEKLIAG